MLLAQFLFSFYWIYLILGDHCTRQHKYSIQKHLQGITKNKSMTSIIVLHHIMHGLYEYITIYYCKRESCRNIIKKITTKTQNNLD